MDLEACKRKVDMNIFSILAVPRDLPQDVGSTSYKITSIDNDNTVTAHHVFYTVEQLQWVEVLITRLQRLLPNATRDSDKIADRQVDWHRDKWTKGGWWEDKYMDRLVHRESSRQTATQAPTPTHRDFVRGNLKTESLEDLRIIVLPVPDQWQVKNIVTCP